MPSKFVVNIDQVLHGYSKGHKELASSISLDDQSRATMLVLSDLLSSKSLEDGCSYLTCYPLRSASKHVLARTWAAGSGYRPGSVWTHSLILDYQAVTLISDLVALQSLFSYPENGGCDNYLMPISFSANERSHVLVEHGGRAVDALVQIYSETPSREIKLPYISSESNETLALALWRQMWPSLRRDFAFTTCANNGSFGLDSGCALRFLEGDYDRLIYLDKTLDEGYRVLLEDLPKPGPTALRAFISRYVIESKQPRNLVRLLAVLQGEPTESVTDIRLGRIRALVKNEPLPRLMRDTLIEALEGALNSRDLIKVVREFRDDAINVDLSDVIGRVISFSANDVRELLEVIFPVKNFSLGESLFNELVLKLPSERLAEVLNDESRIPTLQLRPELVFTKAFWPESDEDRATLIKEINPISMFGIADAVNVFGGSLGPKAVSALLYYSQYLSSVELELMLHGSQSVRDIIAAWIVAVPQRFASIVDMLNIDKFDVVEVLARSQVSMCASVRDAPIWFKLFGCASERGNVSFGYASLIVGYISALIVEGGISISFMRIIYDPLQRAVRACGLSLAEERYLESHLPMSCRTSSLQESLAKSVVLKWSPIYAPDLGALTISNDSEYQADLVREAISRYGRRRLERSIDLSYLPSDAKTKISLILESSKKSRPFWLW